MLRNCQNWPKSHAEVLSDRVAYKTKNMYLFWKNIALLKLQMGRCNLRIWNMTGSMSAFSCQNNTSCQIIVGYFLLSGNELFYWSYRFTHVRSFVRPFVCPEFFSKIGHRIVLKLGMKLKDNSALKLTKPDFSGKIWFIHKIRKCQLLGVFHNHLIFKKFMIFIF